MAVKSRNFYDLRDWLFRRLIWLLLYGDWKIKIYDFENSRFKRERNTLGVTDWNEEVIYLDKKHGGPSVLIHELGHVFFDEVLDFEARSMPKNQLMNIKSDSKFDRWVELRVLEWEKCFFGTLSKQQIRVLRELIKSAPEVKSGRHI